MQLNYQLPRPPKKLDYTTYTVSDYLKKTWSTMGGTTIVDPSAAIAPMREQVEIVRAASSRFESSLFDIRTVAQADLFASELGTARELNAKGFCRGAGAIAGVVLEAHLATVCESHQLKLTKKKPTIADFYDAMKSADVIDQASWRFIQHLGDLRNKCDHRGKDPTKDEVFDLIDGVDKVSKTVL